MFLVQNSKKREIIKNIIMLAEMLHDKQRIVLYAPNGEIGATIKHLQTTYYPDGTCKEYFLIHNDLNEPDKFEESEIFNVAAYLIRSCDYQILHKVFGCRNILSMLKKVEIARQMLVFRDEFNYRHLYEALRK